MLAKFADIADGVLRQRRDLYAVSIALALFHLAGGQLSDQASQSLLQFRLERPSMLIVAAWLGFAYFLYRYWLLAPEWSTIMRRMRKEIRLQTRATRIYHRLALRSFQGHGGDKAQFEKARDQISSGNLLPHFYFEDGTAVLDFRSLRTLRDDNGESTHVGQAQPLDAAATAELRAAIRRGRLAALTRERTFTDYVLPYLFAALTAIIGITDGISRYREPPPSATMNPGA